MPLTKLDPVTALILIDLQEGIVALPTAHPTADIIAKGAALAREFRRHFLPVVLVNVTGGAPGRSDQPGPRGSFPAGFADLVQELNHQPQDIVITKRTWGAFSNPELARELAERNVTHIVLAGVATSIGVESTARQAHELGFNVTIATDAVTDMHLDAHHNSLTRIFPRLAETGTTAQIIDLLVTGKAA